MDVKFAKKPLHCLQPFYGQSNRQEQTQEIRLPDGYPDVGKVLGCWGQVFVRGKEWRSSFISANGGIAVWALYAPEDGSVPRVVDVWIPFQCRWDFDDGVEDGTIILKPMLVNMDCRGISARKMMVRAELDVFAQAMKKNKAELSAAPELPEDVQLRTVSYPVEIPVEAGEKQLQLEENLVLPSNLPPVHKLLGFRCVPNVAEQKILGNRLVFRGQSNIHIQYMTEDGKICTWDTEVPFSQYTELDRDYSSGATAWALPIVTAMELDAVGENQLHLQMGIAVQYTVFDREMVEAVIDAYSPSREVSIQKEALQLPMLLDKTVLELSANAGMEGDILKPLNVTQYWEQPRLQLGQQDMEISVDGQCDILYEDGQGQLQGDHARVTAQELFPCAKDNLVYLWASQPSPVELYPSSDGVTLSSGISVEAHVYSGQPITQIVELNLGECVEPDPERPSMILRRVGEEGLWEIAKGCGSTPEAIRQANHLSQEPEEGQLLLIPIP
ncbi:MAG: hypothetical protein E7462_01465 [Ruminococcaceae bacterium]|nr:hypothetical protein [Oscillospiraceae bacterium]